MLLAGVSFLWSISLLAGSTPGDEERLLTFYGTLFRSWEFAAGALLVPLIPRLALWPTRVAALAGWFGLAMVLWAAIDFSQTTTFPGTAALLPVVGAALMIAAGSSNGIPGTRFARLVHARTMRFAGDVSYSWYLWHWPFIVFAIVLFPGHPTAPLFAAGLSLAPAVCSFRFVENPIRSSGRFHGIRALRLGAACLLVPIGLAALLHVGASERWGLDLVQSVEDDRLARDRCTDTSLEFPAADCTWSVPSSKGRILLVGDSHATSLSDGVVAAGNDLGYDVAVWAGSTVSVLRVVDRWEVRVCRAAGGGAGPGGTDRKRSGRRQPITVVHDGASDRRRGTDTDLASDLHARGAGAHGTAGGASFLGGRDASCAGTVEPSGDLSPLGVDGAGVRLESLCRAVPPPTDTAGNELSLDELADRRSAVVEAEARVRTRVRRHDIVRPRRGAVHDVLLISVEPPTPLRGRTSPEPAGQHLGRRGSPTPPQSAPRSATHVARTPLLRLTSRSPNRPLASSGWIRTTARCMSEGGVVLTPIEGSNPPPRGWRAAEVHACRSRKRLERLLSRGEAGGHIGGAVEPLHGPVGIDEGDDVALHDWIRSEDDRLLRCGRPTLLDRCEDASAVIRGCREVTGQGRSVAEDSGDDEQRQDNRDATVMAVNPGGSTNEHRCSADPGHHRHTISEADRRVEVAHERQSAENDQDPPGDEQFLRPCVRWPVAGQQIDRNSADEDDPGTEQRCSGMDSNDAGSHVSVDDRCRLHPDAESRLRRMPIGHHPSGNGHLDHPHPGQERNESGSCSTQPPGHDARHCCGGWRGRLVAEHRRPEGGRCRPVGCR